MSRLNAAPVKPFAAQAVAATNQIGPLLGRLCRRAHGLMLFLSPAAQSLFGTEISGTKEIAARLASPDAKAFQTSIDALVDQGVAFAQSFRAKPGQAFAALRISACTDPSDPEGNGFLLQFDAIGSPGVLDDQGSPVPAAPELGFAKLLCAVEEAPFGFALYDDQDRLLFGNKIFRGVLNKPLSENLVGRTFAEIARLCDDNGVYAPDNGTTYVDERIRSHHLALGHQEQFLANGTIERIIERRTATGGWVAVHVDITELYFARKRAITAEDETQRMRDRLAVAIDLLPDALVLFDSEDRVMLANRAYCALYQNGATMLAERQSFEAVVRGSYERGEYGDPAKLPADFVERRLRAHRGEDSDFMYNMINGRTVRIVERQLPDGGIVGLHVDLTAIHGAKSRAELAEAEAKLARTQLESAIGGMRDGFAFWNEDEQLVLCNERYRQIYPLLVPVLTPGASFESVLRFGVMNGQHPEAMGAEESFIAATLASWRQKRNSTVISTPEGRVMRVYDQFEAGVGTVSVHVDITEIVQARKEAEAANRTKSMFLAQMSHEIRTPLTGILGLAQLLFDELPDGSARSHAENITRSGETLLAILNDLLDMAKIEMGKIEFENVPFDPVNLSQRMTAIYAPQAVEGKIAFVNATPSVLAPRLGDPHRFMQIINNLLSNAVKFTHGGQVTLAVTDRPDGSLCVTVQDTGIGMDVETLSRIFRPFEQADVSTTRKYGGTGLGMSIVAQLVALMGGKIDVKSKVSVGTIVTVTLPLPFVQTSVPKVEAPAPMRPALNAKVLLADDNAIIRDILSGLLQKIGFDVTVTEDGGQAINAFRHTDFDVILLDISMPVMNGQDVVRVIGDIARATGRRLPPCVAITANTMKHQVEEYLANGFSAHMAKPFRRADLEHTLSRLLQQDAAP